VSTGAIGGMTVVGMVTGTHVIEDLKIAVPYRVAVTIAAEDVLRSRDLQIALQQKKIFPLQNNLGGLKVRGHPPPRAVPPPVTPTTVLAETDPRALNVLEASQNDLRQVIATQDARNAKLEAALRASQSEKDEIKGALETTTQQFTEVMAAIKGLQAGGGVVTGQASSTGVVGGEAPTYIPDVIKPKNADARISVKEEASTAASVEGSANKLRELRRQQKASG